jgi:hypothetical protein
MYFLTQDFPKWDGYPIYNDPQVSVLVSKGTDYQPTSQPTPQPTPQPSQTPSATPIPQQGGKTPQPTTTQPAQIPTVIIAIGVGAAIGIVAGSLILVRKKKK